MTSPDTSGNEGIPADRLGDGDLDREVRQMWATREETFFGGSTSALATHTKRMLELEDEYRRRFPERVQPEELRTRAGSRSRAGQPSDGSTQPR
jgi:hypothetical protein